MRQSLLLPSSVSPNPFSVLAGLHRINQSSITLKGYQTWIVEQRVTDRCAGLPIIVVYTGTDQDSILVEEWQIDRDFKWIEQHFEDSFAQLVDVSSVAGAFMPVTSLVSLPPLFNILQVPQGETYNSILPRLYANINLRRLGLGGRSSLSLASSPPAQQLHFRQSFKLPIPSPASTTQTSGISAYSSEFDLHLLLFIRMLQDALGLFGLGIVKVGDREMRQEDSKIFHFRGGDGLLCDVMLSAFELWRVDVGEPYLHLPRDTIGSVLTPSLVAAVLGCVISAHGKLMALKVSNVPHDPLAKRTKFLHAFETYLLKESNTSVHTSDFVFLSYNSLSLLSAVHHQKERPFKGLSESLPIPRTNRSKSKKRYRMAEELETISLDTVVEAIEAGVGGASVLHVWRVQLPRKKRIRERVRGGITESDVSDQKILTESEPELFSDRDKEKGVRGPEGGRRIQGVFRDVKEIAGRKLGFLGSDAHVDAPVHPDESDGESHTPKASTIPSKPASLTSRLSKIVANPAQSRVSTPTTPTSIESSFTLPSHPNHPSHSQTRMNRRAASEMISRSEESNFGFGPLEMNFMGGDILFEEPEEEETPFVEGYELEKPVKLIEEEEKRRKDLLLGGVRRRHSFHCIRGAEEPWQWLSRRRLEVDMNMRAGLWALLRKEQKLGETVDALEAIKRSYQEALESIYPPLRTKSAKISSLTTLTDDITHRMDNFTSASSKIALIPSRLNYAQSVAEDKLKDLVYFSKMIKSQVGEGGILVGGIEKLVGEGGIKRIFKTFSSILGWLRKSTPESNS